MKIVYFERPYAKGWEKKEKIPMVVEETYPYDGVVDKKILMNDYYSNRVLYYPDIPVQYGTGYEMERWAKDFKKIAEGCSFRAVKARLQYFYLQSHVVVTATEITSTVFQEIKSAYSPYLNKECDDILYKIGDKLYYRDYIQRNDVNLGCGNHWSIIRPEEWIE